MRTVAYTIGLAILAALFLLGFAADALDAVFADRRLGLTTALLMGVSLVLLLVIAVVLIDVVGR